MLQKFENELNDFSFYEDQFDNKEKLIASFNKLRAALTHKTFYCDNDVDDIPSHRCHTQCSFCKYLQEASKIPPSRR